jgi:hypothetical protein
MILQVPIKEALLRRPGNTIGGKCILRLKEPRRNLQKSVMAVQAYTSQLLGSFLTSFGWPS